MKVKVSQASAMIEAYLGAGLVPLVKGSPGIGKSQIVHTIADSKKLKVIDLRLSQCDPTDLAGFPFMENGRARYVPMDTFPIEGDPLPKGFNGWLLFLDELTSASPAVQAASYKIILDRMVGQHKLHEHVYIVGAGNLETDGAIVESMSTALQSRLVHMELEVDSQEWINWAFSKGFDHRITDFIKFKPQCLYTFRPDHTDNTYASPRTWEFANRLMPKFGTFRDFNALLAGAISEGVAHEFITFCEYYKSLPKPEEILKNPEGITVPEEISVLFALTGAVASMVTKDNLTDLKKFIDRLPPEFQMITLKEIIKRDMSYANHPALNKWVAETSARYH